MKAGAVRETQLYKASCTSYMQPLVLIWFFAVDLVEVCHPNNYNIGLLAYSPLAGGALSGKYLDLDSEAAKKGRFNLFPGYMERYNKSISKVCFALGILFLLSVEGN